jgi:hypothetical protein
LAWPNAIANYVRDHPSEFVQMAGETGASYTESQILDKASVLNGLAQTLIDANLQMEMTDSAKVS